MTETPPGRPSEPRTGPAAPAPAHGDDPTGPSTPTGHTALHDQIRDARERIVRELNERQWEGIAYAAHGRHKPHRNAACRVCQGNETAIADAAASAVKPMLAILTQRAEKAERAARIHRDERDEAHEQRD